MRAWITRRLRASLLALLVLAPLPAFATTSTDPEWTAFTRRYLAEDGRVIDTANGSISHSEGQGYGMFFAAYFNDRARFDRIWNWTRLNLSRPRDALFAWRFIPNRQLGVTDMNNATDGEIYIAWALAMAADRWGGDYRPAAERIARDILRLCVTTRDGRRLLLPGAAGFIHAEGVVVNLSYYAFPALRALSRVVPDAAWAELERDGVALMAQSGFGQWALPTDWILVPNNGGPPSPAPNWQPRFSWDAVRVPLNIAWQRLDAQGLAQAERFWSDGAPARRPPAWVDVRTNMTAPYPGHAGLLAVHQLARHRRLGAPPPSLRVAQAPDYFGAALLLQARIAAAMPPEPPAHIPPEATPEPSRWQLAEQASAAAAWLGSFRPKREPPRAKPSAWAREDMAEFSGVRGIPPGPQRLGPPR